MPYHALFIECFAPNTPAHPITGGPRRRLLLLTLRLLVRRYSVVVPALSVSVLGCNQPADPPSGQPDTPPMAEVPHEQPEEPSAERRDPHIPTTGHSTTIDDTAVELLVNGRQSRTVGPGLIELEQTLDVVPK